MTRKKAKPRVSLLVRIALIFLLAMVLSIVIFMTAGEDFMIGKAAMQGMEVAKVAVRSTGMVLEPLVCFDGMTDQQIKDTRNHLRMLCRQLGLKYLYLYSVAEPNIETFYVASAADDEEDRGNQ